ncbi:MAG: DUF58 domain-containing protein [Pseudomonadota bacterium]
MSRRTPASSSITLVHRNSYIFPNHYGFLFLVLLLIMLVGATNYQNNLAFTLTFLLISMGLLSIFYTFKNLVGLTVKCGAVSPVFVDDDAIFPVILAAENKEHFSVGVGLQGNVVDFCNVLPLKHATVSIRMPASQRGVIKLERLYITSSFPLGMFRCWTWIPLQAECLVYPKPIEPEFYQSQLIGNDENGSLEKEGGLDFSHIRNYSPGDSMRHIEWKTFAKDRGLYTKQFSEPTGDDMMIHWQDFTTHDIELKLSYMCFLVLAADKQQKKYGMSLPGIEIAPASGDEHTRQCLQKLALFQRQPKTRV